MISASIALMLLIIMFILALGGVIFGSLLTLIKWGCVIFVLYIIYRAVTD